MINKDTRRDWNGMLSEIIGMLKNYSDSWEGCGRELRCKTGQIWVILEVTKSTIFFFNFTESTIFTYFLKSEDGNGL